MQTSSTTVESPQVKLAALHVILLVKKSEAMHDCSRGTPVQPADVSNTLSSASAVATDQTERPTKFSVWRAGLMSCGRDANCAHIAK